jgi:hypothetical protein
MDWPFSCYKLCVTCLINPRPRRSRLTSNGGAPTAMGHRVAFNNTAKHYSLPLPSSWVRRARGGPACCFRLPEHGACGLAPSLMILMTLGGTESWVADHPGLHADTLSLKTKVCLVLVEALWGIFHTTTPPILPSCASSQPIVPLTNFTPYLLWPRHLEPPLLYVCSSTLCASPILPPYRHVWDATAICKKVVAPQAASLPSLAGYPAPATLCAPRRCRS